MNAFANALLDSSRAAAAVGPNSSRPSAAKRSATPRLSGSSGPTTVKSICSRSASASSASGSARSTATVRASAAIPGLPGAHDELADVAIGEQPGDQRVLARAAAEDENSHCMNDLWRAIGLHARRCRSRDYFVDLDGDCA